MFGIFKRKKAANEPSRFLGNRSIAYAEEVATLFKEMDKASRANVLVAYVNLEPSIVAARRAASEKKQEFSLDGFIHTCEARSQSDQDESRVDGSGGTT